MIEEREPCVSKCSIVNLSRNTSAHTLTMTFLPSGIDDMATSSLASARTSAEAERVETRSTTVDLAAAAESTPIEPTMKYETLRVTAGFEARYLVKSGAATGSRAAAGVEENARR